MDDKIEKQIQQYYTTWNATNQLYVDWARKHGMSYYSFFILYAIYTNPNHSTQKMISAEWLMPKQTVNSILKDFEKKAYIYFASNTTDARSKLICFTDRGRAFAKEMTEQLYTVEMATLIKMGEQTRKEMLMNNVFFYQLLKAEMEKQQ